MIPVLFSDTLIETPTYFLLYMSAFFIAILMSSYLAKSRSLSPVVAIDLGVILFVSGFLGARLFHILFEALDYYLENPIKIFSFWQGGFVLYGGVIAAIPAAIYFLKRRKQSLWTWADLIAPCFFVGLGIGRLGCLSAGCCYGSVTDWWWGILFTDPLAAAPRHLYLHPTQILESVFAFSLAGFLVYVLRKASWRTGSIALVGALSYSVFRFLLEFLRGDPDRGLYWSGAISTSQIISLVLIVSFVVLWRQRPKPL